MANYAGDNLRRLMTQQGLTIEQVVEKSGLDMRTLKGILEGTKTPHPGTIHRLAEGLGVPTDEFFLDPARLVYRHFDRQTNPLVAQVVESSPGLFLGWTEADFDELHSRMGMGGPLTVEGALTAVQHMNRNRELHEKLALLLESSQAEVIRAIVEVLYRQVTERKAEG